MSLTTAGVYENRVEDETYSVSSYGNQTVIVVHSPLYRNTTSHEITEAYLDAYASIPIQQTIRELTQKAKQHQALMQLRADLPKPPPPVPGRTSIRARHGFHQMARLPCYRGRRVR